MCSSVLFKGLPYSRKVLQGKTLVNWLFSYFWRRKVWGINRSANRLLIIILIWMVLVLWIMDDSPNLPNFPPAKLSCYMVVKTYVLHANLASCATCGSHQCRMRTRKFQIFSTLCPCILWGLLRILSREVCIMQVPYQALTKMHKHTEMEYRVTESAHEEALKRRASAVHVIFLLYRQDVLFAH